MKARKDITIEYDTMHEYQKIIDSDPLLKGNFSKAIEKLITRELTAQKNRLAPMECPILSSSLPNYSSDTLDKYLPYWFNDWQQQNQIQDKMHPDTQREVYIKINNVRNRWKARLPKKIVRYL